MDNQKVTILIESPLDGSGTVTMTTTFEPAVGGPAADKDRTVSQAELLAAIMLNAAIARDDVGVVKSNMRKARKKIGDAPKLARKGV